MAQMPRVTVTGDSLLEHLMNKLRDIIAPQRELISPIPDSEKRKASSGITLRERKSKNTSGVQQEKTKDRLNFEPSTTPYDDIIKSVFGKEANNARAVIRRRNAQGKVVGENTRMDPTLDFSGNRDRSVDRGLFQINSNTFADLQRRKPTQLAKAGASSFDDLKDPEINTKVAKIIHDEGGWDRWVAAPASLLSDREKERREKRGVQIIP